MTATESFKAGRLQEAITAQIQEVKSHPADHAKRLFLFEILAFAGDLDRAKRQIDAIVYDELELEAAALAYRKLIESEQARRKLFSEGLSPQFLLDPPEHLKLRLEAVNRLRENHPAEAAETLARAAEAAAPVHGQLNNNPFESLRDCDDLFGTVLEVMSQGRYFWVPLEQIDSLSMNGPKFPRDLICMPSHLVMRDGPAGDGLLPERYRRAH